MKTIADYENWLSTVQNLHQAAKLLGIVRIIRIPHQPNYLEMGLKVVPEGVSTDVLPGGTEVILNFKSATYTVTHAGQPDQSIGLTGKSPQEALDALVHAIQKTELSEILETGDGLDQFIQAAQKAGHDFNHPENKLTDMPFQFDNAAGRAYADALYGVFSGIARFRARLSGNMTPAVVWPGHFDLSGLWFATSHAEESAPHLNFGWSPYGGGIDEPYLYAYAYPMRTDDVTQLPTPAAPAYWHTEGWKGIVVRHRELDGGTLEATTERLCLQIFDTLRGVVPE